MSSSEVAMVMSEPNNWGGQDGGVAGSYSLMPQEEEQDGVKVRMDMASTGKVVD